MNDDEEEEKISINFYFENVVSAKLLPSQQHNTTAYV
jgi:hypothetical protein